jgi:cytochrome P450
MTDPALFPDPDRFDAFRFYDLQQQKNVLKDGSVSVGASVNQFVNSNKNSLVFGYGRHACPGRFLAADELKMILVYFLQAYEIRLEEGESRRYRNLEFAAFVRPYCCNKIFGKTKTKSLIQSIPDPTKTIQMKKLQ